MKGFIELHNKFGDGSKCLIGVGTISYVGRNYQPNIEDCMVNTIDSSFSVQETYEEVKALIAEAQGDVDLNDGYIPKKRLEEWMESKREMMESGDSWDTYLFNMLSVFIVDLKAFIEKEVSHA